MQHGRDHDERLHHAEHPRHQNTPREEWDARVEADLRVSGRGGLRPPEGLFGPVHQRAEHTTEGTLDEDTLPTPSGSNYAPTAQATRRERVRHLLERDRGRVAAGTGGMLRDSRAATVTRESLDEAARLADQATRPGADAVRRSGE